MADEMDPRYWDLEECGWVPSPRTAEVPQQPTAEAAADREDVAVAPV